MEEDAVGLYIFLVLLFFLFFFPSFSCFSQHHELRLLSPWLGLDEWVEKKAALSLVFLWSLESFSLSLIILFPFIFLYKRWFSALHRGLMVNKYDSPNLDMSDYQKMFWRPNVPHASRYDRVAELKTEVSE